MTWFVCQSGAKFNVTFQVIRPTTAVAEGEDYSTAVREKVRLETERAVAKVKEGKP